MLRNHKSLGVSVADSICLSPALKLMGAIYKEAVCFSGSDELTGTA